MTPYLTKTLKLIFLILIGLLFGAFGCRVFISAYDLRDPYSFILTLFASNLIILISAALTTGFSIHLWRLFKAFRKGAQPPVRK